LNTPVCISLFCWPSPSTLKELAPAGIVFTGV
jgi:hypothetical protein